MRPAARIGDMHTCPLVNPGPVPHVGGPILPPCATTVTIGGIPAARVGDRATCVGPPDTIVMGSLGVFIEGRPAARLGDTTAHGGVIVVGCPTVLIGDICGGAASLQGMTMSAARAAGAPFTGTRCDAAPASAAAARQAPRAKQDRPRARVRPAAKTSKRALQARQREKLLKQTLADQAAMLDAKKAELERWDEPAQQNFETWFGTRDEDARKTILGRIERTRELNRTFQVKQLRRAPASEPEGLYAYVDPYDKKRRIYLGKAFDRAPATGANSRAGTLSHEMSHFHGIGDTEDHVYGAADCKLLANKHPHLTLENADSFEYYLENAP